MKEYQATAWAALAMEAYTTSSPIEEQELLFGRAYRLWPDQPIIELYWGVTQGRLKRYEEAESLLPSARAKGSGEFARSIGVKLQRISSLADIERRKRNG